MRHALLVLLVTVSGCIYSIDGSLVDPDQGPDVAQPDTRVDTLASDSTCDGCVMDVLGRVCGASDPCPLDLHCAYPAGGDEGYCTLLCEAQGTLCEGKPEGTLLGCALAAGEEVFCVFFCATAEASYPCPNGLVCALEEQPAGSGQRICVPASAQ